MMGKLNYMHANPVNRGLVSYPKDWRWSSWEYYWGKGTPMIRMDVVEGGEDDPKTQVPKGGTRGTLRVT
jgi:hypothetical protein